VLSSGTLAQRNERTERESLKFKVQGSRFKVQSSRFKVQGSRLIL